MGEKVTFDKLLTSNSREQRNKKTNNSHLEDFWHFKNAQITPSLRELS